MVTPDPHAPEAPVRTLTLTDGERREVRIAFAEATNMAPGKLERWLDTEASKTVAAEGGPGAAELGGRPVGRRVVALKRTKVADLTEPDYAHMQQVTAHVQHQLDLRPDGEVRHSRWRFHLMNWGHDPTA